MPHPNPFQPGPTVGHLLNPTNGFDDRPFEREYRKAEGVPESTSVLLWSEGDTEPLGLSFTERTDQGEAG